MSSINLLSAMAKTQVTQQRQGGQDPIAAVSDVLKLSKSEIKAQLKAGKSLDDIAKAQGVSHDDLVAALKKGMPAEVASSDKADQIAQKMASQVGGPKHAHGHHGPPPPPKSGDSDGDDDGSTSTSGVLGSSMTPAQTTMLKDLASLLGTTSTKLMDSLKGGQNLADLVKSKGVSSSSLAGVLQDGLLIDTTA